MKTKLFLAWAAVLGEWSLDWLVTLLLYAEPILFIALTILAIALVVIVRKNSKA